MKTIMLCSALVFASSIALGAGTTTAPTAKCEVTLTFDQGASEVFTFGKETEAASFVKLVKKGNTKVQWNLKCEAI